MGGIKRWWSEITAPVTAQPVPKVEPKAEDLLHMEIAKGEIGQSEFPGSGKNPRIAEYHKAAGYKGTEDDAWCSSYACWVLEKAGYKSTNSAWARSFLEYGEKLTKPKYGCLVIYSREPAGSGNGHVHFYHSETATHILGIGGNQDNLVKVKAYPKSAVLGYRWPIKA